MLALQHAANAPHVGNYRQRPELRGNLSFSVSILRFVLLYFYLFRNRLMFFLLLTDFLKWRVAWKRTCVSVDSPGTHLSLQAVGSGRVPGLQEARRGGPAGRVLPGRRLLRSDPRLPAATAAKGPVEGEQGGVAAAADVERHIWGAESSIISPPPPSPPVRTSKHINNQLSRFQKPPGTPLISNVEEMSRRMETIDD